MTYLHLAEDALAAVALLWALVGGMALYTWLRGRIAVRRARGVAGGCVWDLTEEPARDLGRRVQAEAVIEREVALPAGGKDRRVR